jgi:hypothetical protein
VDSIFTNSFVFCEMVASESNALAPNGGGPGVTALPYELRSSTNSNIIYHLIRFRPDVKIGHLIFVAGCVIMGAYSFVDNNLCGIIEQNLMENHHAKNQST